jgi:hypothetical protein
MRKSIIIWSVIWIPWLAMGQSIDRKVTSAAGASVRTTTIQVDFTVGEVATRTLSGGTVIVTQGFHQGVLVPSGTYGLSSNVDFRIFPNPVSDELVIELTGQEIALTVLLTDISGRKKENLFQTLHGSGMATCTFDMRPLIAGVYVLVFLDDNGNQLSAHPVIRQ